LVHGFENLLYLIWGHLAVLRNDQKFVFGGWDSDLFSYAAALKWL
jgi:hypothetical protein